MSMHKEIKHLSLSNFLVLKVKSVLSRSYHIHNQEQPSTNPQFGSFFYTQHTVWDTACLQPLLCLHAWPWGTRVFHPMLETTHMSLPAFVLIKTARWEIETWKNTLSPFLLRCGRVSSCLESVGKKKKKDLLLEHLFYRPIERWTSVFPYLFASYAVMRGNTAGIVQVAPSHRLTLRKVSLCRRQYASQRSDKH